MTVMNNRGDPGSRAAAPFVIRLSNAAAMLPEPRFSRIAPAASAPQHYNMLS